MLPGVFTGIFIVIFGDSLYYVYNDSRINSTCQVKIVEIFQPVMSKNTSIANRLMQYLDLHGVSIESFSEDPQFGEKFVFSKSTLGKAKDGEGGIRTLVVEKFLLRFPEVNPYWLILGRGIIYNKESQYGEPVKVMPLDAWESLKESNRQFAITNEADKKEKAGLVEAIVNFSRGSNIPHKS